MAIQTTTGRHSEYESVTAGSLPTGMRNNNMPAVVDNLHLLYVDAEH